MTNPQTAVATTTDFQPREVITVGAYPRDKYNVLIRGEMSVQVTPFLRPVKREVTLDPDPAGGDVYPITQKKQGKTWVPTELGISAVGLNVLAGTAGILDVPQGSGRVDDGRDKGVCTYRATIAMRMPDGQWRLITRECTIKLETIEKEITDQKTKKGKENRNWSTNQPEPWSDERIAAEIRKELLLKEKFLERLAETGAKTRAVRAALAIKSKYTPAELARPFVLAAIVPDVNAPEMRERLLDQATAVAGALFGPSAGAIGAAPRQLAAGPSAEDVKRADVEPASELTRDELGALGLGTEPTADDDDPGPDGQAQGQTDVASWLDEAAPSLPSFAQVIRDSAADPAAPKGGATRPQMATLQRIFAGFGKELVGRGLAALWGDEAAYSVPTAAQVRALELAYEADQQSFRARWEALVEGRSA